MKFEEALPLLREGKKIRRSDFKEGEYLMGCLIYLGDGPKWLSITKMREEYLHPDMRKFPPFIYVADIMADDWELVE